MANMDIKVVKVADIKAKLEKAQSLVLIDYKGLTVEQDTELRKAFRESGVAYEVMKNRLLGKALEQMGYSNQFEKALNGPTAVAMGMKDMSSPAKIAFEKSTAFKKLTIKCGFADGSFFDEAGCKVLATLPTKEGLISQLLGMLQAPIASFARTISAIAEKQA